MMMRPYPIANHKTKITFTNGVIIRYIGKGISALNAISSLSDFLLSVTGIKSRTPIKTTADIHDDI